MPVLSELMEQRKHPRGVYVMFTLQLLLMVGFCYIRALLVLYCTHRLGFENKDAYALYGAYGALIFATPVIGGLLGERFLGYKFACSFSFLLATVGLMGLCIPSHYALYVGLSFFVVGTGIMVPCTYVLLGRLYVDNQQHRDSGFTIAYIGMNVGGLLAFTTSGPIVAFLSFHTAFMIGAVFMLATFLIFFQYQHLFESDTLKGDDTIIKTVYKSYGINFISRIKGIFLTLLLVPIVLELLQHARLSNIILLILGGMVGLAVIYYALQETGVTRLRLFAFLVLTILSIAFWSLYMLAPTALTIFIEWNVHRHVLHSLLPTSSIMALNPFFIITIGPLITLMWSRMANQGRFMSIGAQFATGIFLMGCGYLVLCVGIHYANQLGFSNVDWIILSYFLQTLGELFVGPICFSMVGRLVPQHLEGMMMGVSQLATGIAGALSSYLAYFTITEKHTHNPLITNSAYSHAFLQFGLITIAVALFTILINPKLKQITA